MKRVTNWMIENLVLVISYLEDKNPGQDFKSIFSWKIVALCLDTVAKVLANTCSCLQELITLLIQQHALFNEHFSNLSELCMVKGYLSDEKMFQIYPAVPCVRRYEYAVRCANALASVRD